MSDGLKLFATKLRVLFERSGLIDARQRRMSLAEWTNDLEGNRVRMGDLLLEHARELLALLEPTGEVETSERWVVESKGHWDKAEWHDSDELDSLEAAKVRQAEVEGPGTTLTTQIRHERVERRIVT